MKDNKIQELTISTREMKTFNFKNCYTGSFLYGELGEEMKTKSYAFSFDQKTNFKEGIHNISINEKPCTFFLKENDSFTHPGEWYGLLVYNHDKEYDSFKEKYIKF